MGYNLKNYDGEDIVVNTMDIIFSNNDEDLLLILKSIGKLYRNNEEIRNLDIDGLDREKAIALNMRLNQLTSRERHTLVAIMSGMLWHDVPLLEL